MWKYVNKDMSNQFLLSLHLLNNVSDKEYIRKIYSISNNINSNYKVFKVKKNRGGYRIICAPSDTLKHIQRRILEVILNNKSTTKYATAYKKGLSIRDNAVMHSNKKIILKLDIKDFFQSITFAQVYSSCFSLAYFPKSVGVLLTYLVTYNDYLPQGAPTSACISNLVMRDFDNEVGSFCEELGIVYTRYSDDMTFSGDFDYKLVINYVKKKLKLLGMELNYDKVLVVKNNCRQIVTGIVVNEAVQVTSAYRKKLRQEMYYIKKYGFKSHVDRLRLDEKSYFNVLYGKILYVLQVNSLDSEFMAYKKFLDECGGYLC